MTKVFISHSSQDKAYVAELDKAIKIELGNDIEIFASSLPKAIPSGSAWFDEVMKHLEEADILILIKTRNAENSIWVGFELGYFWKKKNKQNIFVLLHPKTRLLSPIDTLQAKSIFDEGQLVSFFEELCKDCNKTYEKSFKLRELVGYANDYIIDPMAERSLERFEYLIENANWSSYNFEGFKQTWICMEDMLFQIHYDDFEVDYNDESWLNNFQNPKAKQGRVNLKISGATVYQIRFISLSEGRYFVPEPKKEVVYRNEVEIENEIYYWLSSSLSFKTGKLISDYYYGTETIDDFIRQTGIKILDEPPA